MVDLDKDGEKIKEYFLLEARCGILGLRLERGLFGLTKDDIAIENIGSMMDRSSCFGFKILKTRERLSRTYSKETVEAINDPKKSKKLKKDLLERALRNADDEIDTAMLMIGQFEDIKERIQNMLEEDVES